MQNESEEACWMGVPGGKHAIIMGHGHLEKNLRPSLQKYEKPMCPGGEEQGRHKFKPYPYSYLFMYMPNLFSIAVTRVFVGITGHWFMGYGVFGGVLRGSRVDVCTYAVCSIICGYFI